MCGKTSVLCVVIFILLQISYVLSWPSNHNRNHYYDDEDWHDPHFHHNHGNLNEYGFRESQRKQERHDKQDNAKSNDYLSIFDLETAPTGRIMNRVPPSGLSGKSSWERGIVTDDKHASSCRCIDVKKCPAIIEQIQWRPIDDDLRKRLRSAACGFRGAEPQVCCPQNFDEGRARRTPIWSSHEDDYSDNSSELDFDQFSGHWHTFSNNRPANSNQPKPNRPANRNQPRPRTPPVIWPTGQQATSTTQRYDTSKETSSNFPDKNSKRDERIVNNGSLINPRTCGVAINNRIIGGDDAGPGQFPWVARVGYKTPGTRKLLYRCGGAMINKDYVVTAAHCVTNLPQTLQLFGVRLGEVEDNASQPSDCTGLDCADAPQDFRIGKVTVHPRYDTPRFANDIALIRLSRSANLTGYVSPICLPAGQYSLPQDNNLAGNTAIVAGWGSMTPDSATSSTSLQWVKLSVGNLNDCISTYRNRFNISVSQNHMCTRPKANVDACQGDSGGPLVMESPNERYLLAGIVSFGPRRCGTADLPGVYTRVSSFVDWIIANVRP